LPCGIELSSCPRRSTPKGGGGGSLPKKDESTPKGGEVVGENAQMAEGQVVSLITQQKGIIPKIRVPSRRHP